MALAVATPTGAVTELNNGIILVRCADYVGAARGTLSVVTDALSVGGDVVVDTQTRPVQTAFTSITTHYGAMDNSVRVPISDLNLHPDVNYRVYGSFRWIGSPPATAQSHRTAFTHGDWELDGIQSGWVAWGIEPFGSGTGFRGSPFRIMANENVPQYLIYAMDRWIRVDTETHLRVRGWGVAGGDQEIRIDMLYLVPIEDRAVAVDPEWTFEDFALSFGYLPMVFQTNGVVDPDEDDDATSAPWLGSHSVLKWGSPYVDSGEGLVDVQEDDDESSAHNHAGDGAFWDFDSGSPWVDIDPPTYLAYIAGLTHLSAVDIVTESPFPTWVRGTDWDFIGGGVWTNQNQSDGFYVTGTSGGWVGSHSGTPLPAGVGSGWEPNAGGFYRNWIPTNQANGYTVLESVSWGLLLFQAGGIFGGSSTDPSTHRQRIRLENGVVWAKARFDVVQDSTFEIGFSHDKIIVGGLHIDSSGDVELGIRTFPSSTFDIAALTNVGSGYSANDEWWIKIEKRGYFYRAKAWADGDTEPDWQVDGHEFLWDNLGNPVPHPYDANWDTATEDTVVVDPRGGHAINRKSYPYMRASVGDSLAEMAVDCLEFYCSYDPGDGTPGDTTTKVLKYDDSVVLDTPVTIPYGSHVWVYGPIKQRRFNTGQDTFNIRIWKDPANPPLSPGIIGHVWEKRSHVLVVWRPQIYRRVVSG